MEAYAAPEAYADPAAQSAGGNGWYGESAAEAAPVEQQGFSIPTTGQTNGGGPMRRGGGGSRFNPMGRGKPGGGDPGAPVSAASAEKNELGYIIFAYNIGYQTDEGQLHSMFSAYGTVAKVNVIQDFATGQGKGFGFVTMPNSAEAETAINSLNGTDFNGNTLQIRFKTPKGQNPPPPMRGGRGGGFRGGRGGGFRGVRGGGPPRGGGFRGGRGAPRGAPGGRGRGRGAYSSAPSAYDGYGYAPAPTGYDSYGYPEAAAAPAAAGYGGAGYEYADPYAGYAPAAGTGYTSYGAAGATGW